MLPDSGLAELASGESLPLRQIGVVLKSNDKEKKKPTRRVGHRAEYCLECLPPGWQCKASVTVNRYMWSVDGLAADKMNGGANRHYVYANGERLFGGWLLSNGDVSYTRLEYYVHDYQGSVRSQFNQGAYHSISPGNWNTEYYPYGGLYSVKGGSTDYDFLGKRDPGAGLHNIGPRWYNSFLGRFLSPDPLLSAPSAYAYTAGNPVMQSDPSGMKTLYAPIDPEEQRLNMSRLIARERDLETYEQEQYYKRACREQGLAPGGGIGNQSGGIAGDGLYVRLTGSTGVSRLIGYRWVYGPTTSSIKWSYVRVLGGVAIFQTATIVWHRHLEPIIVAANGGIPEPPGGPPMRDPSVQAADAFSNATKILTLGEKLAPEGLPKALVMTAEAAGLAYVGCQCATAAVLSSETGIGPILGLGAAGVCFYNCEQKARGAWDNYEIWWHNGYIESLDKPSGGLTRTYVR